jgi:peptidoglycan hydrolase-like protein with peptidoglycan-binding domain
MKNNTLKFGLIVAVAAIMAVPALSYADTLTRQLEVGSTGSDVSALQTFLAQDSSLYPQGLVTSYYGFLTKAAVSNFQSRNGIPAVGRVGPATLPVLNFQMSQGMNGGATGAQAPIITSVSIGTNNNSATIGWNTNESSKGLVYYSASPLMLTEYINSVTVGNGNSAMTDANYRTSQNVSIQNLNDNTTYYYMVYTTDQTGNVSVTWPSTFRTN